MVDGNVRWKLNYSEDSDILFDRFWLIFSIRVILAIIGGPDWELCCYIGLVSLFQVLVVIHTKRQRSHVCPSADESSDYIIRGFGSWPVLSAFLLQFQVELLMSTDVRRIRATLRILIGIALMKKKKHQIGILVERN